LEEAVELRGVRLVSLKHSDTYIEAVVIILVSGVGEDGYGNQHG
jgi:hypothetical protein